MKVTKVAEKKFELHVAYFSYAFVNEYQNYFYVPIETANQLSFLTFDDLENFIRNRAITNSVSF